MSDSMRYTAEQIANLMIDGSATDAYVAGGPHAFAGNLQNATVGNKSASYASAITKGSGGPLLVNP